MTQMGRKRATYADLEAAPPDKLAELIDGELFVSPRPGGRHAKAAGLLYADLVREFDGDPLQPPRRQRWWLLFEPELHLDNDVVVPDIAGWKRERWTDVPDVTAFTDVPDWVCEVTSPGHRRLDRTLKLPLYARHGVQHVWLVDPADKSLEVIKLDRSAKWKTLVFKSPVAPQRVPPFDEAALDLARWWIK
jgi:Uma2 family endonuclease